MSDIIEQVKTSLDALTQEYETITHNLANISTAGYKRRCNTFSKSLDEQMTGLLGQMTGTGAETYSPGSIELTSSLDFSQGNFFETGRSLDFAISGKGFFVIETPNGPLYTRNGSFNTNQNGQIINPQGQIVAGEGGPITIPSNVEISQVSVSSDGSVSANGIPIGKFQLVDFENNEAKLVPAGDSCYQMPDQNIQPVAAENIIVKQGRQELSNVKMIEELVDMIMVSRLYEANMKFIAARKEVASSITSAAMA
ncbi:MAG: flagellar hook basal-body protein [Planctomycetes bacterium]|nr:flagellar hook basal-body protein [Planctomycetota bacterium]MBL7145883.1 flagellar hook basal-body protein [Phycisphaerae bacterium]